jgi:hypothetical protein
MPGVEGGEFMGSAMRAAREGVSGNRWLRILRDSGTGIRRAVGLKLFAAARRIVAESGEEPFRDLTSVPEFNHMAPMATNGASGILQTVRLTYRERVTGNVREVFYSVKSDEGITRQSAINKAVAAYSSHSEEYETDLMGAVHTGATRLVPVRI